MVRGTTILKTAVARIATGTTQTTTTTTSGSGLCSMFRRALFCARICVWEYMECAKEESRPVPAVLVTSPENQTCLGSLVSVTTERLPNLNIRDWANILSRVSISLGKTYESNP